MKSQMLKHFRGMGVLFVRDRGYAACCSYLSETDSLTNSLPFNL